MPDAVYNVKEALGAIAVAIVEGNSVVINANW
jgi:hypothetical protein